MSEEAKQVQPEEEAPTDGAEEPQEGANGGEPGVEEGEQPAGAGGDVEPTPEPASDTVMEEAFQKLEREAERHRRAVVKVMGEEESLAMQPCPLCQPFGGLRFPVTVDEETKAEVLRAVGELPADDFNAAPNARTCDTCGGFGEVLTGSKRPDQRTTACAACTGRGWVGVAATPQAVEGYEQPPPLPPADQQPVPPPTVYDAQGRPQGHPDFGKMPWPGSPTNEAPPQSPQPGYTSTPTT